MKSLFKKLFHRHIWKENDRVFLREERLPFGAEGHITTYAQFRFYAVTLRCVDCGKIKIVEKRTVVI
jgi:hypothetical protein